MSWEDINAMGGGTRFPAALIVREPHDSQKAEWPLCYASVRSSKTPVGVRGVYVTLLWVWDPWGLWVVAPWLGARGYFKKRRGAYASRNGPETSARP